MKNGLRGARKERELARRLRASGDVVMRSAASKGPYDLAVIGTEFIRLIQVKRRKSGKPDPTSAEKEAMEKAPAPLTRRVWKEIWVWVDRKGWIVYSSSQELPPRWIVTTDKLRWAKEAKKEPQ